MLKFTDTQSEKISKELVQCADALFAKYPKNQKKSAILPLLHQVQKVYGWLSVEKMNWVAQKLEIQYIEVYEVATFYSMFHLKPQARFVLEICQTGPCALLGAEKIVAYLKKVLNVEQNEITSDGLFSYKTVECLASCDSAPVLQIGPEYQYYEHLDEKKIDELIETLKEKARLKK